MAVETPSLFARVIQDHLELKRQNADLEPQMPIDRYRIEDPFDNNPLFKSEEQARLEETMDGEPAIDPSTPDVARRGDARTRRRRPGRRGFRTLERAPATSTGATDGPRPGHASRPAEPACRRPLAPLAGSGRGPVFPYCSLVLRTTSGAPGTVRASDRASRALLRRRAGLRGRARARACAPPRRGRAGSMKGARWQESQAPDPSRAAGRDLG